MHDSKRTLCIVLAILFCDGYWTDQSAWAQNENSNSNSATQLESTPADLVFINAQVLTCETDMSPASAVAIRGGRIISVGQQADVAKDIGPETTVIDAQGLALTPGLTDSHLHFVGLGQSLQMLDLSLAKTWDEIVDQVAVAAESLPQGTWIEGRGWHQSKWTETPTGNVEGYPNHRSMSDAVPHHPVILTHASGHACFANQAAMELAGVDASTSDPSGGEILKTKAGDVLGVFRENAQGLIRTAKARTSERLTPTELRESLRTQIQLAGSECLTNGITSVHDAGSSFSLAQAFQDLAIEGALPVRVYMMIRTGSEGLARQLERNRIQDAGDGFLTVRSIKLSIDGALGPHGAWLLQPYSDLTNTSGLNTLSMEELETVANACKEKNWQLCVHAIGDRANREALDVFQRVLDAESKTDHRWRIEHAQHLSPEDIPRFATLGVIPAMQANHCTSDAPFVPQRLGERRSQQGAYVWRSLLDSGTIIPNGTDTPVERIDPRVSLFAAVTRELSSGDAFYPEQCMTRREALLSYTLWPALASFQEAELGSITVGKRADLALWDTNLLTCTTNEILTAQVLKTIINGEVVFEQGGGFEPPERN